jgi:D-glycero-D-manno-heptose 1,7-bisphosphate phosphatase
MSLGPDGPQAPDRPQAPAGSRLPEAPRRPAAVLLDRDGTLITETGYLTDPAGFDFVPGAPEAVARLNAAGIPVALVTNQSAIARGWLTPEGLEAIHAELARRLAERGARLDRVSYCPHHPDQGPDGRPGPFTAACECRKPAPGQLVEAARAFGVDPAACVTIGDSDRDLEAGERCGAAAVLVLTGKGRDQLARARTRLGREPVVAEDLAAAVERLLGPADALSSPGRAGS